MSDPGLVSKEFVRQQNEVARRVLGGQGVRLKAASMGPPLRRPQAGREALGQYKGMVHVMVADVQDGWEFPQFIPYDPD